MKKIIYTILFVVALSILIGCKAKTIYVPVESEKSEKEYVDRWQYDSIYLHDSIFVKYKGDTVWLEKYKTYYKEKTIRDSIYISDSVKVAVPYPVPIKGDTIYKMKWYEEIVFYIGLLAILLGGMYGAYRFIKHKYLWLVMKD